MDATQVLMLGLGIQEPVFIGLDKKDKPAVFAAPGKGKETVKRFKSFLTEHQGKAVNVPEVVCDMSRALLSAAEEEFPDANVTLDWFHVVRLFTKAVDEVRKAERKIQPHPKSLRRAVLKNADGSTYREAKRSTCSARNQ